MKYKIYFLVLLLSLTSCASNKWKSSEVEEIFVTDIKPSGLKIFNYSLTNTMAQASGNAKRDGGSGKGTGNTIKNIKSNTLCITYSFNTVSGTM